MEKMVPQMDDNLINCNSQKGPSFGFNDLSIGDQCDIENISIANFPFIYNRQDFPYEVRQDSKKAFVGVTSGLNFRVKEY